MDGYERTNRVHINRNSNIFPDHTIWIKEQFSKKKIMYTRGREVLIKAPGRNLKKIVNIPPQNDPDYKNAWINVYNLCLDYLEGTINTACIENRFIQRMGNSWTLNGHTIVWPKFDISNADYARGLEKILDEYVYVKRRYIEAHTKKDDIIIEKRKVSISPVVKKSANISKTIDEKRYKSDEKKSKLAIQKTSDGDILTRNDIDKLITMNTDIVLITCQDVMNSKEESIFIQNSAKCNDCNIRTGIFLYGMATNGHEATSEIKRLVKMIQKTDNEFSKLIVYAINSKYLNEIKESDIKILDYVNVYNSMLNAMKKAGFNVMLSMNNDDSRIIEDINKRYNMKNEQDIIYMVLVRDMDEISNNSSVIVVDPWNDFDTVNIKNEKIINAINLKMK